MNPPTKSFPLRTILTVTTGYLLTKGKGPRDNGIGDLYEILQWMTDNVPFTHQLGRFSNECKPFLLKWFPELALANAGLKSLDDWIKRDRSGGGEAVKMWFAELQMMHPSIQSSYEVPKIPRENHSVKNPVEELVEMRAKGGKRAKRG
jgi:hypothetical protein